MPDAKWSDAKDTSMLFVVVTLDINRDKVSSFARSPALFAEVTVRLQEIVKIALDCGGKTVPST